jgi:hypothetical protein
MLPLWKIYSHPSPILAKIQWPLAQLRIETIPTKMNCPHCGKPINPAAMLGSISSPAKAQAARENAKLGGWSKGKKRGKRKRIARRSNGKVSEPAHETP